MHDPITNELLFEIMKAFGSAALPPSLRSPNMKAQGERHIRLLAPLAFLSPRIIAAIVDGTAPADLKWDESTLPVFCPSTPAIPALLMSTSTATSLSCLAAPRRP